MPATSTPPTKDADLTAILQAYNDVTERLKRSHESLAREVGRLHEELHEKNKELVRRERLSALGEMAAGVAHEIRNPLGGIGLYVSLLERDLIDRPKELDIVRKMGAGVRNLESIVSDILAFAGDSRPNIQNVKLSGLLSSIVDLLEPQAEVKKVRLVVDRSLEAVEISCDAAQIERALINLLTNALDAVDEGGTVQIHRYHSQEADSFERIVVVDDGPGLPSHLLQRIFNPFFTTKDTGTGLGLAIVHRIAEENGGTVSAGNGQEGGARFVLSIPKAH